MDRKEKLGKLMAAVSRYDRAAFAELMSLTRDKLTRTAYADLRDGMLAEDCVNETYAALASHCLSVAPDRVEAWLRTVVVNKALNVLKKRRRELPLTEETAPPAAPEAEERAAVRSALERMPERERLALLYRANGYTLEETASAMKCSVKKLRGLLDKARARFVTLYGEGGDE